MAFYGMPGPMELLVVSFMTFFWALILILPFWLIFSKAGFPGVLSLLMLIPLVNVGMLFFLAFVEWPALKHRQYRDHDDLNR